MINKEIDKIYAKLVENGFFTEQELQLITCINGYSIDTLNDCIYARYGYSDYEQLMEYEV